MRSKGDAYRAYQAARLALRSAAAEAHGNGRVTDPDILRSTPVLPRLVGGLL